jgi:hypothetical protein
VTTVTTVSAERIFDARRARKIAFLRAIFGGPPGQPSGGASPVLARHGLGSAIGARRTPLRQLSIGQPEAFHSRHHLTSSCYAPCLHYPTTCRFASPRIGTYRFFVLSSLFALLFSSRTFAWVHKHGMYPIFAFFPRYGFKLLRVVSYFPCT